jgi:hypothetical protein
MAQSGCAENSRAADFDFQDNDVAQHYTGTASYHGPGVVAGSHNWTPYDAIGTYTNDGVTLILSRFDPVESPPFQVNGLPPYHGTPAFTLSQALPTHGTGQFELDGIPAAPAGQTYKLYLYGTDAAADAGSQFNLAVGSGLPDLGISTTTNAPDPGQSGGPNDIFAEGRNYVAFDDVVPVNGTVTRPEVAPRVILRRHCVLNLCGWQQGTIPS